MSYINHIGHNIKKDIAAVAFPEYEYNIYIEYRQAAVYAPHGLGVNKFDYLWWLKYAMSPIFTIELHAGKWFLMCCDLHLEFSH